MPATVWCGQWEGCFSPRTKAQRSEPFRREISGPLAEQQVARMAASYQASSPVWQPPTLASYSSSLTPSIETKSMSSRAGAEESGRVMATGCLTP